MNKDIKIKSIEELGKISSLLKEKNKKIILCHGTFDLLHIGHLRHFKKAKNNGNVLFVTITGDKFVIKGPGRPVFSEELRAEMLSALNIVDYVGIVNDLTAIPSIEKIKPQIYFKGSEYKNIKKDLSKNIEREIKCVKKYGGKFITSDEIVFSSSSLLNKHFQPPNNDLDKFINLLKKTGGFNSLKKNLDDIVGLKVLFIGETIIDEYAYVDSLGKSSKENIVSQLYNSNETFIGGVIAASKHTANFCKNVRVLTAFGTNDSYEIDAKKSLPNNIKMSFEKLKDRPTTRKQRFIDRQDFRKMSEIYFMDDQPIANKEERKLLVKLENNIKWADVVIVNDFGHGMITESMVKLITKKSKFLAINVQSNSGNRGFNLFTKYSKANFLCIDEPELRIATQEKFLSIEKLIKNKLKKLINVQDIIITHGQKGCYYMDSNNNINRVPALNTKALDSVGAGDAFLSITSPLVANKIPLHAVSLLGNIAGAIKVNILGHRTSVDKTTFLKYLETLFK